MGKRRRAPQPDPRLRTLIAQNAARILTEGGQRDFAAAKRKAAAQLGITDERNLPDNAEVEAALLEHQRLFHGSRQTERLRALRETALQAMTMLAEFQPCLVGPVLNGTADDNSVVYLHLFANTAEEVLVFLLEQHIPFEQGDRRVRYGNGRTGIRPKFSFIAGDTEIQLTVFPPQERSRAPLSPIDGRPQQRANRSQVESLLRQEA